MGDMLQGTLDMLILQTLVLGPAHGHSIAHAIERRSQDILQVEHGSLYPALYRLEASGWIACRAPLSSIGSRPLLSPSIPPPAAKTLATETTAAGQRLVSLSIAHVLRPAEE